jgi:hypothetical protein
VRGLERFVCRDDPPAKRASDENDEDNERLIYTTTQFDKAFMSLLKKAEGKKISDALLGKSKGSVMHFESMIYRPGSDEFAGANYNLYRRSVIVATEPTTDAARAAVAAWDEHMAYLLPDQESRDHLLNWVAWRIQNPGRKPKHALVLQGAIQGTGKSYIAEVLERILGASNVSHVTQRELASQFNPWARDTQLIVVEELRAVDRREVKDNLHPLITQERISINDKHVKLAKFLNCFGVFAMTNNDAAIQLDNTDRRYLILKTEAQPRNKPVYGEGWDPDYYVRLYALLDSVEAMGAIAWELRERDLGGYNAAGPAPMTSAKVEMSEAGATPLEYWMTENAGEWPLCARLTTADEIIQILPKRIVDKYTDRAVADALKSGAFNGIKLRVPVNGVKKMLWAINNEVEVNRLLRERDAAMKARETVKVTNRNAALAAIYLDDIAAARRNGSSDFDDGGE